MKASSSAVPDFENLLGPSGPLSHEPGYEYRRGQVELARRVWDALAEGRFLLAEAGTGTGKSLAYLIPAFSSDRRIVISTGTKTLQEQLVQKDIPLCSKVLDRPLGAVNVKGRANYLCLFYFDRFKKEPLFRTRNEAKYLEVIQAWAERTKTGDRAELSGVPEDLPFWQDINARSDRCLGSHCPVFEECFVVQLRRKAEAAEVVVTNHHLLFADLMVRNRSGAMVLPEYTHLVMDEAHEVENAATSFFGVSVTRRMLQEWIHDASRAFPSDQQALHEALAALRGAVEAYFGQWGVTSRKVPLSEVKTPAVMEDLRGRLETCMEGAALSIESRLKVEGALGLLERLESWREGFQFVLSPEEGNGYVHYVEAGPSNVILSASPIEVGSLLGEHLFGALQSVVFTSATLSVGNSFSYLRDRLGVPEQALELRIPSPFRYEEQGLFYVPNSFPAPNSPDFEDAVVEEARRLVTESGGRAFILCTSYRNMRAVAPKLAALVPFPVLCQGDEPKGILLERFRKAGNAVLVATVSFWQGVDVQGEALSLVVLDKLPFASPSDPLTQARIKWLTAKGREPFREYQLPEAAILLQQGAGRLIRSGSDRGVVACLDIRLATRSYGRLLLESLPPFRVTRDAAEVARFFREGRKEAGRVRPGR